MSLVEEHTVEPVALPTTIAPPRPGAVLPRAPERSGPPRTARRALAKTWLIRIVAAALALLACLWVYEKVVTTLVYQQRQQHLSSSFQTPKPTITEGDAMGVLQIPVIGLDQIVIEGAEVDNLRSGPARLAGGALPGDAGVMVVYGHRSAYGAPFAKLTQLKAADQIVAQARSGPIVKYVVQKVIRNGDVAKLDLGDEPKTLSYLVLVTSERGWTNSGQVIVIARALPVSSTPALIPGIGVGPGKAVPFGIDALLGLGALGAGAVAFGFLRRRATLGLSIAVVLPIVGYAVVRLLALADTILPLTR